METTRRALYGVRPQIARPVRLTLLGVTLLLLTAGQCPGGGGGGITIAQSDSTNPELSFGTGQSGGQNVSVSQGGSAQTMQLIRKTGAINLLATAKDPETGIQSVQIWITTAMTTCDAGGICSTTGPGLVGTPRFESTGPQKSPGESTAESSILADSLDLTQEIPQGTLSPGQTRSVRFEMWAVAVNHLGGQTQSPTITATWQDGP